MDSLELGASLYVPAVRADLLELVNGTRHSGARSLIMCTEDSLTPEELPLALKNLRGVLLQLQACAVKRFIRVRDVRTLDTLLQFDGIESIDGFVLPKCNRQRFAEYFSLLEGTSFHLMPVLETREVFCSSQMAALRDELLAPSVRPRILSLRIGGCDLLNLLGIRRSSRSTIYETALGIYISLLAGTFRPFGFNLTGTVFEGLNHPEVLRREVQQDLQHGLFGKTAVHPDQVRVIENLYAVTAEELEQAQSLMSAHAPAVFRMHGVMCEKATHLRWARSIIHRSEIYGCAADNTEERVSLDNEIPCMTSPTVIPVRGTGISPSSPRKASLTAQ